MGAEVAVPAAISVGTAILGHSRASHAERSATRSANEQRAHQESQATLYKKEQAVAAQNQAAKQDQLNKQIARGNRRRVRGGLFGDPTPTQGVTRQTLG